MTTDCAYHQRADVVLREEQDAWALLFNPASGDVVGVNPVGVALWNILERHHTVPGIVQALRELCADVPDESAGQVTEFLDTLSRRGFVTASSGA